MKAGKPISQTLKQMNKKSLVHIPVSKKIWRVCLIAGITLWIIAILLWKEQSIDKFVLFYYDPARISGTPGMLFMLWLTNYGMAVLAGIYVVYLLASQVYKQLNAPLQMYLYTICSLGLSGIAGDLLKEVFARPRPIITYANEIFVLYQSLTPAIPSGHATKSIALVIPFIFFAANTNKLHRPLKIIMIIVSLGVCFSRIMIGVHYVSDVVAGIGMAIIGFPFSMLFANMILKQTQPEQLAMLSKIWGLLLIALILIFMVVLVENAINVFAQKVTAQHYMTK